MLRVETSMTWVQTSMLRVETSMLRVETSMLLFFYEARVLGPGPGPGTLAVGVDPGPGPGPLLKPENPPTKKVTFFEVPGPC